MKKFVLFIALYCICIIGFAQYNSGSITILHTNDMHSKLIGFSPELEYTPLTVNDDNTTGGFARLASVIKMVQDEKNGQAIVLDAGDFLMGSFFHLMEAETGFQLRLMKKMGYDVVTFGNHEFDYGPVNIAKTINNARLRDEIPIITCANISFEDNNEKSYDLQLLYENRTVVPYTIIKKSGLKIGVFGLLGYDARDVAPNMKPVVFEDPIKVAKRTSKYLKNTENCDLVICLSHGGVEKNKNGEFVGEDVKLAKDCPFIDIIIGGHTHTALREPIIENDILIVQTGAYAVNVGRIDVVVQNGKITSSKYQLISLDDKIEGDLAIHHEIEEQKKILNEEKLKKLGYEYDQIAVKTNFDLICDDINDPDGSNLGPLIVDAIHYYVKKYEPEGTHISLVATGLIRDKISLGNKGYQSVADIFRVMSLGEGKDGVPGYPLAKVYVNGKELKNVMEVLLIAPKSSTNYYCYFSGAKIYYDPKGGFFNKIKKIEIDGVDIDLSKNNKELYGLVADSYMLEFIGLIKKLTYGLLSVFPKDSNGNKVTSMNDAWIDFDKNTPGLQEGKEWIALLEFFKTFEQKDANGVPIIPDYYKEAHINMINVNTLD